VQSTRRMLERMLDAWRGQDWEECAREVRTLVEVTPDADEPRLLLASLCVRLGNHRAAVMHYRRLLPQAIAHGAVLRAIFVQRRIDALAPTPPDPARWIAMQRDLRAHGLPAVTLAPGASRPWTEAQLLALPREAFERLALEAIVETPGLETTTTDVDADTVWEVISGRMRWSFAMPDGRASAEILAAQGDAVRIDPDLTRRARVTFVPELPVECLRIEPTLVAAIRAALAMLRTPGADAGLTSESRALLPSRLRRAEDIDRTASVPDAIEHAPRLLDGGSLAAGASPPPQPPGDDWIEHRTLSLDVRDADATPPAPALAKTSERTLDLNAPAPAAKPGRPVVERPGPVEMGSGLIVPPSRDPFAAPIENLGEPIERRRHPRVAASITSRIAMLRLAGSRVAPVEGEIFDLSTSGLGVRFAAAALGAHARVLLDSVVAVDLVLPGDGDLRVAGQVRWIDEPDDGGPHVGIEFVLLTEQDRRRIAGALARVAEAA
jgi:hypothetical protein